VCVVRELKRRAAQFPHVDFQDLGTAGLAVLHAIAGRRKVVFIDCAFMGEVPGSIRRFAPDDVTSAKVTLPAAAHAPDLLETLRLSRALGQAPAEVVIFGIQPTQVAPGEVLSPALRGRLEDYADAVAKELIRPNAGIEGPSATGC